MDLCGEREGEEVEIENQAETEHFNECVCLCMCEMIILFTAMFQVCYLCYVSLCLFYFCVFICAHPRACFYNYSVNHNKCRKSDGDG